MPESPISQRIDITVTGTPPARQIAQASGVSDVEVDGHTVRCVVCGSVQPLLEALRGHEVLSLATHSAEGGSRMA